MIGVRHEPAATVTGDTLVAASSPDWAVRARAARQLAARADHPDIAKLLLRLLLDREDTAVTDAAGQALLERNDLDGLRPIAHAVATAGDPEYLDHLHAAVTQHLLPAGPVTKFHTLCSELACDPDPTIKRGALCLLAWAQPWAPPA